MIKTRKVENLVRQMEYARQHTQKLGHYNPQGKIVCCIGCGRDTTEWDMLCDNCKGQNND